MLVITPSRWPVKPREFAIDEFCDINNSSAFLLSNPSIKEQIAERKILGTKFCKGVVTMSDAVAPMPFKIHSLNKLWSPREGLELTREAMEGMHNISNALQEMKTLASTAAQDDHLTSSMLSNIDTQFQKLVSEIDYITYTQQYDGLTLFMGWVHITVTGGKNSFTINLPNLTLAALQLDESSLNVYSRTNAAIALSKVTTAEKILATARNNLQEVQQALANYVNANSTTTTIDLTGPQFVVHTETPPSKD